MARSDMAGIRGGAMWWPSRTLLLLALALALWWGLGPAPQSLVYDRAAIAAGEWWRLLSAHWVHSDASHALWDMAALALLGMMFEPVLKQHLFPVLLFASVAVDAWLLWGGGPEYYCGLSGILNSLLAAGLLALWRQRPHILIPLTGLGLVGKNLVELGGGAMLFSHTAWPGVPEAHLAGMLAGALYAACFTPRCCVRN